MEKIISKLYEIIKDADHLIQAEEKIQQYMQDLVSDLLGEVLTHTDHVIKKEKQEKGWLVKREDWRTIQCMFGPVSYRRTLMSDEEGKNHYPLDEWIGIRKRQRYSPLVEVKVAELASESTYRETSRALAEWTSVSISHQTVGTIVRRVGQAQAAEDEKMVIELEEAASLPKGRKVDHLYAEADGVFVRGTQKKKSLEVSHAIIYEGWDKNGKRVSLKEPKAIMTTHPTDVFWKEVQAFAANRYSLEGTQIITNSDGGKGYTAEKFQEAFSQSRYPVLNQLDSYHVYQSLNRALGAKESQYKTALKKAIKERNRDEFVLQLDTYESSLDDPKKEKKVKDFRTYILGNWDRIFDWREVVENPPEDARTLGAMESNQRHITFRMKKRGMHWSVEGGEAMVKIKQGILNKTLRDAYLNQQRRSARRQKEVSRVLKMSQILRQATRPSVGVKQGAISLYQAHSSAMGKLAKIFS